MLNANRDLHQPDRLTVRALINCTLDGLLTKPPLYTQKILEEFLRDLEDAAPTLTTEEKLKKFLEARYLTRMPKNVELSIFRNFGNWFLEQTMMIAIVIETLIHVQYH